jgi:hypothetical protein
MKSIFLKNVTGIIVSIAIPCNCYAITFHKPLVINNSYIKEHGRVIVGNYAGTLTQPAISILTSTPVIIRDSTLQGPGDLIYTSGGDLTVINTTGTATNPNMSNMQKGMFINANFVKRLEVSNCTAQGVRFGVYVNSYTGDKTSKQAIRILNNTFNNIDGRPSDGNNGYVTSGSYIAHAIQLNQIEQVPNIEIAWNQVINQPLQSQSSDMISIYDSSGINTNAILIHDNYLQGAYPSNPGKDTHYYGGGISIDGNTTDIPTTTSAFVSVYNNHIVSTADYGLQILAGHDNVIFNNRVISSGRLSNGTLFPMTYAVGLNNINFYNQTSTTFFNNHIHDNTVGLIAVDVNGKALRSDMNLVGQGGAIENNTAFHPNDAAHPTIADEQNEYQLWQQSLKKINPDHVS